MDDVIFEEFKGTGNSEICLDRKLSDKRIFPAMDIQKSGTRKEDLLIEPARLAKIWVLRKILSSSGPVESMELLLDRLGKSRDQRRVPGQPPGNARAGAEPRPGPHPAAGPPYRFRRRSAATPLVVANRSACALRFATTGRRAASDFGVGHLHANLKASPLADGAWRIG